MSIYDARNNFSSLVKQAETGSPVELTRHDKPVAVLLSYDEYRRIFDSKDWFRNLRTKILSCNLNNENLEEGLPFIRSKETPCQNPVQDLWSALEET